MTGLMLFGLVYEYTLDRSALGYSGLEKVVQNNFNVTEIKKMKNLRFLYHRRYCRGYFQEKYKKHVKLLKIFFNF